MAGQTVAVAQAKMLFLQRAGDPSSVRRRFAIRPRDSTLAAQTDPRLSMAKHSARYRGKSLATLNQRADAGARQDVVEGTDEFFRGIMVFHLDLVDRDAFGRCGSDAGRVRRRTERPDRACRC